jgi:polysaccharide pyruvyl transferase WcaK-like protein
VGCSTGTNGRRDDHGNLATPDRPDPGRTAGAERSSAERARHRPRGRARVLSGKLERHLVGFSVREPGPAAPDIDPEAYHALLANSADFMVDRYDADVVFVPMERTDVQHSHGLVAHMQNAERAEILRRRYSPRQVLSLMGRFDFAVGMRLHFLIFAALRGTPFAALPYASKVLGLLEDLEMQTPPMERIGTGQLLASIDRSWDTREQIRAKITGRLPELRRRAKQTNELLVGLLRERFPERTQEGPAAPG